MAETENKVYILICLEGVSDKISGLIDAGYFGEAKNLDYNIWSLKDKIKSLISTRGGEYLLGTYERHVLYLPLSIAENLPLLLEGYKNVFGDRMYVGIGLTLPEAKKATDLSMVTGKIEMYDPEEEAYQDLGKSDMIDGIDLEREIFETSPQPNVFDRQHPEPPKADATKFKIGQYVPGPDAQTALQLEAQMIQATVQVLNAPAQQAQQQMQQQMEQMQQQQAQQQEDQKEPSDLKEALSGEKSASGEKKESSSEKEKDSDKKEEKDEKIGQDADKDSGDDNKEADKLATLLEMVNEKVPKLTDLADKNPEAFKKVIGLVHKIVDMAKEKKKDLDKQEIKDMTEELNKAIKMFYPVGTVKQGKKKVMKDGKASWRSVKAGMVKDNQGNAISVQSHNDKSDDGTIGVRQK